MIHALREGHLLPMVTPATVLGRIGRIDFDEGSPSFFRFGGQSVKELRPRGVCNAFSKTMVMGHAVDMQVFDRNDTETVYDLPGFLMGKIISPESSPLMHTSNNLAMLTTLGSTLRQFALLALHFGKGFLFLAEKPRMSNLFTIREGRKGLESDIYSYARSNRFKAFRLTLHRKGNIPFVGTALMDGTRLNLALHGAMVDHLESANLGKGNAVVMGDAETRLRKGETLIAAIAFE